MKELRELRYEVLELRNMREITKQTESILLHKLNALQEAINKRSSCVSKDLDKHPVKGVNETKQIVEDIKEIQSCKCGGKYYKQRLFNRDWNTCEKCGLSKLA